MAANGAFTNMKVPEPQKFLKERDIHISANGKSRQGAELLELCKNAAEIVGPKLEKETVQRDELINSKITLAGGKLLPHPLSLKFWTHDFTGIPDLKFLDINHCLVGKDGFDEDFVRSYKSLEGSRLFTDGHVDDLKYHGITDDGIRLAKVGNAVKNFIDSSFFSTSSMPEKFPFQYWLVIEFVSNCFVSSTFFISSTC